MTSWRTARLHREAKSFQVSKKRALVWGKRVVGSDFVVQDRWNQTKNERLNRMLDALLNANPHVKLNRQNVGINLLWESSETFAHGLVFLQNTCLRYHENWTTTVKANLDKDLCTVKNIFHDLRKPHRKTESAQKVTKGVFFAGQLKFAVQNYCSTKIKYPRHTRRVERVYFCARNSKWSHKGHACRNLPILTQL